MQAAINICFGTCRPVVLVLVAVCTSAFLPTTAFSQTTITSCGQTLLGDGVLAGDLDCTGFDPGLILDKDSRFQLSGFTFTGSVRCDRDCIMQGPGTLNSDIRSLIIFPGYSTNDITISSLELNGTIDGNAVTVTDSTVTGSIVGGTTNVSGSTVTGSPQWGVFGLKVSIANSTVSGNAGNGVWCRYKCEIDDSVITGNYVGILCNTQLGDSSAGSSHQVGRLELRNSSVSGNSDAGVYCAHSVEAEDSIISNNGADGLHVVGLTLGGYEAEGKHYGRVELLNTEVKDNAGQGVETWRAAKLEASSVTGNGKTGISARVISLSASDANGNGIAGCDPPEVCVDVLAYKRLTIVDGSTCGTSSNGETSWGLCSLD